MIGHPADSESLTVRRGGGVCRLVTRGEAWDAKLSGELEEEESVCSLGGFPGLQ